jgi:hypothetical protein
LRQEINKDRKRRNALIMGRWFGVKTNCGRVTVLELNELAGAEVSWVTTNRIEIKPCHFIALEDFGPLEMDCPNRR